MSLVVAAGLIAGCEGSVTTGASTESDSGSQGVDGSGDERATGGTSSGGGPATDASPDESVSRGLDGSVDRDDGSPQTCEPCPTTLQQACMTDGGFDCPPDLGSAAFFDWAQRQIGNHPGGGSWLDPSCFSFAACPDMVVVWFGVVRDGEQAFLFDSATKKLVAIAGGNNGALACNAASSCVPLSCLSRYGGATTTSPVCPALPDAGLLDARAD